MSQTAREALLSLAAGFDRRMTGTFAEADAHAANGDDDASCMAAGASDAWRAAAREARLRAQDSSDGASEPAPVSREGHVDTEPLSASLTDGEVERVGRAAYAAYVRLRTEQMQDGRTYPAWDELDLNERFAWEVAAVAAAEADRARLYAELGNDHYVIFTGDGWTTEHSIECRLSGRMSECEWHEAVRRVADEYGPDMLGRWRITGIDSEGLPDLERADG